jgi:transposase
VQETALSDIRVVVGLLVTPKGFPIMHEVFKANKFEGHTMLDVVKKFQKSNIDTKPVVVADAAMLSKENMHYLETEGYRYIVGAQLANVTRSFIDEITNTL